MALVVVLSIGILLILEYFIEFLLFRRVNQSPLELETLDGTGLSSFGSFFQGAMVRV